METAPGASWNGESCGGKGAIVACVHRWAGGEAFQGGFMALPAGAVGDSRGGASFFRAKQGFPKACPRAKAGMAAGFGDKNLGEDKGSQAAIHWRSQAFC
jgi:hypothetical protein